MTQAVLVQPGTTLFHIAAKYLLDATQWSRIALINDLQDPLLCETVTLELPTRRTTSGPGNEGQL